MFSDEKLVVPNHWTGLDCGLDYWTAKLVWMFICHTQITWGCCLPSPKSNNMYILMKGLCDHSVLYLQLSDCISDIYTAKTK